MPIDNGDDPQLVFDKHVPQLDVGAVYRYLY